MFCSTEPWVLTLGSVARVAVSPDAYRPPTMNDELRSKIKAKLATQLGVISFAQLHQLGVSTGARTWLLQSGELVRVDRCPEVLRDPVVFESPEQKVMATLLACGDGAVASHTTAAALIGVSGYRLADRFSSHVSVAHDRHPRAADATIHYSRSLPANHLRPMKPVDERKRLADFIPTTSVARTLFDLGRMFDKPKVERAVDSALAADLVTVTALDRVLRDLAGPGRAGTRIMRELVEERGAGFVVTRSRLEKRFLQLCGEYGLPEPRREIDLGTEEGWNGRVEFVFDPGVLAEIDGRRWHTALLDQIADEERDNAFRAAGFIVLRFRYRILRDHPAVVATRVLQAIETAKRLHAA